MQPHRVRSTKCWLDTGASTLLIALTGGGSSGTRRSAISSGARRWLCHRPCRGGFRPSPSGSTSRPIGTAHPGATPNLPRLRLTSRQPFTASRRRTCFRRSCGNSGVRSPSRGRRHAVCSFSQAPRLGSGTVPTSNAGSRKRSAIGRKEASLPRRRRRTRWCSTLLRSSAIGPACRSTWFARSSTVPTVCSDSLWTQRNPRPSSDAVNRSRSMSW